MPSLSRTVNSQQLTINKRKGFTLIELLVVITIIAILIAAGAVSYTNAQRKGRDARRKSDLKAIQQGLDQYFSQNGKYPAGSSGSIQCNVGSADTLTWGTSAFTCNSVTYMNQLPKDPTSQTYGYYYLTYGSPVPTSYVLSANLENNNDPDRTIFGIPCLAMDWPNRDYCVVNP